MGSQPTHSSGIRGLLTQRGERLYGSCTGSTGTPLRAGIQNKSTTRSILYPLQPEHHVAPLHLRSHLDRHVIGIVGEPDHKLALALEFTGSGLD